MAAELQKAIASVEVLKAASGEGTMAVLKVVGGEDKSRDSRDLDEHTGMSRRYTRHDLNAGKPVCGQGGTSGEPDPRLMLWDKMAAVCDKRPWADVEDSDEDAPGADCCGGGQEEQ